jgi:hypothetical protein
VVVCFAGGAGGRKDCYSAPLMVAVSVGVATRQLAGVCQLGAHVMSVRRSSTVASLASRVWSQLAGTWQQAWQQVAAAALLWSSQSSPTGKRVKQLQWNQRVPCLSQLPGVCQLGTHAMRGPHSRTMAMETLIMCAPSWQAIGAGLVGGGGAVAAWVSPQPAHEC